MQRLLARLKPDELIGAIGRAHVEQIAELLGPEAASRLSRDPNTLAEYALALYGREILDNKSIRRLVFKLIDPETLAGLATRYAKKEFEKPADNALVLAAIPWRAGAESVGAISRALNIPKAYLPEPPFQVPASELIEPVEQIPPLHPYQRDLVDRIVDQLRKPGASFLVQMPTGAGKTRTAVEAILRYVESSGLLAAGQCILWMAHTEELCEQAIETFRDIWQVQATAPIRIIRMWGRHHAGELEIPGSLVVGTFQKLASLHKRRKPQLEALQIRVALIVADEAHKILAPTFAAVARNLQQEGRVSLMGLTATPGRAVAQDRENKRLAELFGHNLLGPDLPGNTVEELRKQGILSRINRQPIYSHIDVSIDEVERKHVREHRDFSPKLLRQLGASLERNRQILAVLRKSIECGDPCVVFACSISHARLLAAAANLMGCSAACIDSTMRKGTRRQVVDGFRSADFDILVNFGVLSTGFDAPRIRTVVITRSTASVVLYSQMIGRGLRGPRMGGAEVCNLVDVIDNYVNFRGVEDVYSCFKEYWA